MPALVQPMRLTCSRSHGVCTLLVGAASLSSQLWTKLFPRESTRLIFIPHLLLGQTIPVHLRDRGIQTAKGHGYLKNVFLSCHVISYLQPGHSRCFSDLIVTLNMLELLPRLPCTGYSTLKVLRTYFLNQPLSMCDGGLT